VDFVAEDTREYFVKPSEKLTDAAEHFKELDRFAYDFGRVQDDMIKLNSLPPEEHSYVMCMAYLYASYRLGNVSKERCVEIKKQKMKECRDIHNAMVYARHLHARWTLCTKVYHEKYKELAELIKNRDPQTLRKALELIDILSDSYIYSKLYDKSRDPNEQMIILEDIADEVLDERAELDRKEIKRIISLLLDEFEGGKLPVYLTDLTEETMESIHLQLPERQLLTEEILKELKPRV
jgi:hypothetical protein